MQTVVWSLIALTLVTRIAPLLAPNKLHEKPWMKKAATRLPFAILTLLLIHYTEARVVSATDTLPAFFAGITVALVTHYLRRLLILSITMGVLTYALVSTLF